MAKSPQPQFSKDRRAKRRFAIHLPVSFKIIRKGLVIDSGKGHIRDISSKGIAFTSDKTCKPRDTVTLVISWPALLEGVTHLKLVAEGTVVRCEDRVTAAVIRRQEFHIQASTLRIVR